MHPLTSQSIRRKMIISIIIVLLLVLAAFVGYALYLYNEANDIVSDSHAVVGRVNESSSLRDQQVTPVSDNVSVLFIGVDNSEHRNEQHGRSDALILATFNKDNTTVKLLSIPRDSYVYVPEVGYSTKINHAHAYGGPKAAIETVEDFLNIPVDYYVRLNFDAFVDVVDALGGISFDVPFEMLEPDSMDNRDSIHLSPGFQRLNGEQALALARSRKYDNDMERGNRQQEMMKSILNEIKSVSSVFKLEDVIRAVGENMTTNLKTDELSGFFSYALSNDIQIKTVSLEGEGGYMEDGGWYFQVDEESRLEVQEGLREHLGLEPLVEDEETEQVYGS